MIFLQDNVLIEKDLKLEDVKPRLLGHWGTCPGLILIWSHLNLLIRNHDMDMIFVVGPGHGAPAALASLWLEGSLEKFFPDRYTVNKTGLRNLIAGFSTPRGFPRLVKSARKLSGTNITATSTHRFPERFMKGANWAMLSLYRLVQSWITLA
jgi:xylulose-5-phosphate/fructose-6-phosphate phosphoketolase